MQLCTCCPGLAMYFSMSIACAACFYLKLLKLFSVCITGDFRMFDVLECMMAQKPSTQNTLLEFTFLLLH